MAISSAAMTEESAGGNLLKSRLEASRKVLLEKLGSLKPEIGIILGSGLGPLEIIFRMLFIFRLKKFLI